MRQVRRILILGSGTDALDASDWPREDFDAIVAINNAWQVRPDWTHLIYPEDFPPERRPQHIDAGSQSIVTAQEFVPVQNMFGGFVYAGGTMAFTAGYWALGVLKPDVMAFFGCDMIYAAANTHFYGRGTADPLRKDITLQSLEAKSARLMLMAARQGCLTVNLSRQKDSRLVFPRFARETVAGWTSMELREAFDQSNAISDADAAEDVIQREADLGYMAKSGRYWDELDRFDPAELRKLDALWLQAALPSNPVSERIPVEREKQQRRA
ncbi:MAG: hypothetical protein WCC66_00890 [Rhizobiaceae bacterium]